MRRIAGGPRSRSTSGFTIIEVTIAMTILAIAAIGTISTLLMVHQYNQSSSENTVAYKACQEIMEQLVAMNYDQMKAQDGLPFAAKKLHPDAPLGSIMVVDISPASDPDTLAEIRVAVRTQPGEVSLKPINVEIVSWRTRK